MGVQLGGKRGSWLKEKATTSVGDAVAVFLTDSELLSLACGLF